MTWTDLPCGACGDCAVCLVTWAISLINEHPATSYSDPGSVGDFKAEANRLFIRGDLDRPNATVVDETGWPTHLRSNVDLVCFCDPGHDLIQDCPAPKPRPSTHP